MPATTEEYATKLARQVEACLADIEANPANTRILQQIGVRASLVKSLKAKARCLVHEELKDKRIVMLLLTVLHDDKGLMRNLDFDLPEITTYALAEMGYPMKGLEEVADGRVPLEHVIVNPEAR